MKKTIVLEQGGLTRAEAVAAWSRAFRVEAKVIGRSGSGIITSTFEAGKMWICRAVLEVSEEEFAAMRKERERLGLPLWQRWEDFLRGAYSVFGDRSVTGASSSGSSAAFSARSLSSSSAAKSRRLSVNQRPGFGAGLALRRDGGILSATPHGSA